MSALMIKKGKKKAKRLTALLTGGIRESLTLIVIPVNLGFKHIF